MTTVARQLRDFAIAATLAILIATVAFVAVRNHELAERQVELAERAVTTATERTPVNLQPLPALDVVLVGGPMPSPKHPLLFQRRAQDAHGCRVLSAKGGPNDKLRYDAANRADRERIDHRVAELLADGSGRAIAVLPTPLKTLCKTPVDAVYAIAITPPASPAPYPFLVLVGVLGLGAAIAAAGAMVSVRAARIGTFAGIATLAVPCVLWHAWVAATAIVLVGAGLAFAQHARFTDRFASGLRLHRTALGFLAPAAIAMVILVAAPFIIGLVLGFYDHHHGTWTFVGLRNFGEILSGGGRSLDDPLNFWFIFGVTVLWTLANVALHVSLGVALALVLSRTWLRGKGLFRMLFILPWAVPNYITALIWKGMFEGEYGAINSLFRLAGLDGVSWFSSWSTSFAANVTTNTWLGFPFMMVVALGALESIPKDLYEAASVDGANAWQRFRHITLPHLRPALGPAVALGSIWTFNMFNVIYLVSAGQPGGATNILVTDAYRWAFERGERYGMAAAYATIIFLVLLLWNVFGARLVKSKEAT
ncbi:MAG: sugar ABC transporter permease [Kofleriaceae bacterium]|nr:sugar ABC transporter permease [Kofleriaceae bacterium]